MIGLLIPEGCILINNFNMSDILKYKIQEIFKDCNFVFNKYVTIFYEGTKNEFWTAIMFKEKFDVDSNVFIENEKVLNELLEDNIDYAVSALSVIYKKRNFTIDGEIYNNCTKKEYRNMGFAKKLIYLLISNMKFEGFKIEYSLGIDLRNDISTINKLTKLYNNVGFYINAPEYNIIHNVPCIIMRNSKNNYDQQLLSNIIKKLFDVTTNGFEHKLLISKNVIKFIKSKLSLKYEISGNFNILPRYENNVPILRLALDKFNIIKGDGCSVHSSSGVITFHTHPKYCYEKAKLISGFPSPQDLYSCYNMYSNGNQLNFVFAKEGFYEISLTKEAKVFSIVSNKFSPLFNNHINSAIHDFYEENLFLREKISDPNLIINLNEVTLSKLGKFNYEILDFIARTSFNFKIFNIQFIKYDEVQNDNFVKIESFNQNINTLII